MIKLKGLKNYIKLALKYIIRLLNFKNNIPSILNSKW